ncbi:MAG: hypothetical protein IJ980_05345 [Oscillospiraceae bacterium]|nr:hypothetical protein [Oscillospiraceae bacterium]
MKNRKLFDVAVSLLLAFLLWNFVSSDEDTKYDYTIDNVPIVCSNEQELQSEYGLMISERPATSVSVTYNVSRADIKHLRRYKDGIKAVVDTSTFTSERDYSPGYKIQLPPALQDRSLQIVKRTPSTVRFTVEKIASKTVPVKGVFDGTFAAGFDGEDPVLSQDSVTITGPAPAVERVQHALAILYGDKVSESFSESVALMPVDESGAEVKASSMTLSEKEVTVTLTVLTEKEVPLKLEIIPGGGATEENTTVTLSRQSVVLRGEKATLDAITELTVGELALGELEQNAEQSFELIPPDGTELVSQVDEVTAKVSFEGLETRKATVSSFRTEHVNENTDQKLGARVHTHSLNVVLRGPDEKLTTMEDVELIAVADLTAYTTAGRFTVPVTIRTTDEAVGAVGEYSIEIDLYTEG